MKSLDTIQKLSKIGRVLSKIAFVFSVVGICGCIAGLLSLCFGNGSLIKIGGVTLHALVSEEYGYNIKSICAVLSGWMAVCAGEAVLAKFAEHYFKRELADGTPFTFAGAKEMQRLGILTICLPIGTQIVAEIVHAVMEQTIQGVAPLQLNNDSSVTLGIMFIVLSLICRYGAELREGKA